MSSESAVAAVASVARMRTKGCLRISVAAVDGLADRGLDDLELGPGLGDRADAVALDLVRSVGGVVGRLGDDLQRLIGGREGVLALEGHIERGAHQQHQVRPVITVPVSQAKLSSRPCGISPSVDCTVSAGPSSKPLALSSAAVRLRCAGFNPVRLLP